MGKSDEVAGVKEIASRAKVSLATVDRVLHNRTGVSKSTRARINAIIKELNYQPNILARSLASKKMYKIAVLIPEVSEETAYWKAPIDGIKRAQSEVRVYGINIEEFFFDQNDKSSFSKQAKLILESDVDGIIMAPSFIEESIKFTAACNKRKIPFVFINSDLPTKGSLCYIGPHLYKSGYLAAHLANFSIDPKGKILIVNISKEIEDHHHLLQKEEGFRSYFADKNHNREILKIDISQTTYAAVEKRLAEIFESNRGIKVIFVTNSRVASVSKFLEKYRVKGIIVIGYDFLTENIEYLKKNLIDFLICQKPEEQGYKGIMALYQHLVLSAPVEPVMYMPIDIITKENFEFYKN